MFTVILISFGLLSPFHTSTPALPTEVDPVWPGWSGIERMFVFGDSYSRTGFRLEHEQPSAANPLGNPPLPGKTSSNFLNWVGFLTVEQNASAIQTVNFARGGAVVDHELVSVGSTVKTFRNQVQDLYPEYARHQTSFDWTPRNTLHCIWIGFNDIVNGRRKSKDDGIFEKIFESYPRLVEELYRSGARNFLFLNLPAVEQTPMIRGWGSAKSRTVSADVAGWNANLTLLVQDLKRRHRDVTAFLFDYHTLFNEVLEDHDAYEETRPYENTTWFCKGYCPSSVDRYFWINNAHPTFRMHNLTAKKIVETMAEEKYTAVFYSIIDLEQRATQERYEHQNSSDPIRMASYQADQLKEQGNTAFKNQDYETAEALYTQAIQKYSRNQFIFTNRANARLKLQKWEGAVDDCLKSIEISGPRGQNHKAYYFLAQAQLALHHPNEALSSAETAYQQVRQPLPAAKIGDKDLMTFSQFVLKCKQAKFAARDRERLRRQGDLRAELEQALETTRQRELDEISGQLERHAIGQVAASERSAEVWASAQAKIADLRAIFMAADPAHHRPREVPDHLVDMVTFEPMHDPVVTKHGHSYERATIYEHLKRSPTDPLTREPLSIQDLRPNVGLRQACEAFWEKCDWISDW
nr:acetylesterase [Quercus suber]